MAGIGTGVIYIPNPHFEEEALKAEFVRELLEKLGEEGASLYADGVPIDTSDLKNSVFYDVQELVTGWVLRIGATDWKAALVELGTSLRSPDGSLRRAVEALGIDVMEVD